MGVAVTGHWQELENYITTACLGISLNSFNQSCLEPPLKQCSLYQLNHCPSVCGILFLSTHHTAPLGINYEKKRKGRKRFLGDHQRNFDEEYKHGPWSTHLYRQNCFAGHFQSAACHFDPTKIQKCCKMRLGTNSAIGFSYNLRLHSALN